MSNPILSVIVPVYNAEKTLKRCVESIISQDIKELELILVDDGSTDMSSSICDEYSQRDSRITVIHKKNEGVSKARNAGVDAAKGSFIAFCDNDDYIMPGMYSRMLLEIQSNNADICACHFLNGNTEDTLPSIPNAKKLRQGVFDSYLLEESMMTAESWVQSGVVCAVWNKVYARDSIGSIRFEDTWGEDYAFNDLINNQHKRIVIIEDAFYVWCANALSQSHQRFNPKWVSFLSVLEKRVNLFLDNTIIVNSTKKQFCDIYVEYYMISLHRELPFPLRYKRVFLQFYGDLILAKCCNMKFYVRMSIFTIFPRVYYFLTMKTWDNYTQ